MDELLETFGLLADEFVHTACFGFFFGINRVGLTACDTAKLFGFGFGFDFELALGNFGVYDGISFLACHLA